jgi:hypothetical protein
MSDYPGVLLSYVLYPVTIARPAGPYAPWRKVKSEIVCETLFTSHYDGLATTVRRRHNRGGSRLRAQHLYPTHEF